VDDVLDFTGTAEELGKPIAADLELGLVTAPVLFAAKENRELIPLIQRQFQEKGDPQRVISFFQKKKKNHLLINN